MNILNWIIGLIVALIGGFLGVQKHKTNKAIKEKDEAIETLEKEKIKVNIAKVTDEVKDELVKKKKILTEEKTAKIKEVAEVKEVGTLNEEIKTLAAAQSARARARAKRLQNKRKTD